jgi:hypothetical protein
LFYFLTWLCLQTQREENAMYVDESNVLRLVDPDLLVKYTFASWGLGLAILWMAAWIYGDTPPEIVRESASHKWLGGLLWVLFFGPLATILLGGFAQSVLNGFYLGL